MYFICVFNHSKSCNTLIDNIIILRIYLRFAYEAHCSYTYHILYCFSETYIIIKHIYHILVYLYMDIRTNYRYLKDHPSVFARCISNGIYLRAMLVKFLHLNIYSFYRCIQAAITYILAVYHIQDSIRTKCEYGVFTFETDNYRVNISA